MRNIGTPHTNFNKPAKNPINHILTRTEKLKTNAILHTTKIITIEWRLYYEIDRVQKIYKRKQILRLGGSVGPTLPEDKQPINFVIKQKNIRDYKSISIVSTNNLYLSLSLSFLLSLRFAQEPPAQA